jgi:hypothetical protein
VIDTPAAAATSRMPARSSRRVVVGRGPLWLAAAVMAD